MDGWAGYLRFQVKLPLNQQLLHLTKLSFGGSDLLIRFEYERLPNFCYLCGLLEHTEKECAMFNEDHPAARVFSPWLRSQSGGRYKKAWINDNGEGGNSPSQQSGLHKSPNVDQSESSCHADRRMELLSEEIASGGFKGTQDNLVGLQTQTAVLEQGKDQGKNVVDIDMSQGDFAASGSSKSKLIRWKRISRQKLHSQSEMEHSGKRKDCPGEGTDALIGKAIERSKKAKVV